MEDNKDEEHLDNPPNTPFENSSDVIIPTNDTETIYPNQESENMEVHHHAHHEGKKNWKSYIWEFLMLFLAVFCGFLAEYQLEHMIEKDRGKQYIISFYKDLKYDTSHLTQVINNYKTKAEISKEISICYDSVIAKLPCKSCLKNLYSKSQGFYELRVSDRTMQQLKNAGGLRLLKSDDADSILAYDNLIRGYKVDETTTFQETQTTIRDMSAALFSYAVKKDQKNTSDNLLITDDRIIINKYFNTLDRYARYSGIYVLMLEKLKSKAINIMHYFNKKYHIE